MDPRTAAIQRRLAALTGKDAFTLPQVARLFGVHPNTLRNAERDGRIPSALREQGGATRVYTPADLALLKRYLASQ